MLSWQAASLTMKNLPTSAGIGFKAQHFPELLAGHAAIRWLEIHPENYMGKGGPAHQQLSKLRQEYALSMHGVGMSLGNKDGCDARHLARLKSLVERYQPEQISEHIAWSHWNAHFFNDLLPLPYLNETLDTLCRNIDKVQNTLGRRILVENPSTYIDFCTSDYSEPEFFRALSQRSGCGILLDLNNVFVSAHNNSFNAQNYLNSFPLESVEEIHLAGHSLKPLIEGNTIRIDDHGSRVCGQVWQLYEYTLAKADKAIATLIEWDTDIPPLAILESEADKANAILSSTIPSCAAGKCI